jgi:hypothetical protein
MRDMDRVEDGELGRRLRAYAEARLSPDHWAMLRVRGSVIEHGGTKRGAPLPGAGRRLGWRPALFTALIAVLAVTTGASAGVAASPGGPLYGTRVWVESALVSLSSDRADAQAALVDKRIDEATDAADSGNGSAVSAALAAYRAEVDGLLAAAGNDPSKLERVQAELGRHIVALQALAKSNPQAANAIQAAIDASQNALDNVAKSIDKAKSQGQDHSRPSAPPGKPSPN